MTALQIIPLLADVGRTSGAGSAGASSAFGLTGTAAPFHLLACWNTKSNVSFFRSQVMGGSNHQNSQSVEIVTSLSPRSS